MKDKHIFTVSVPTTGGFFGRECNSRKCARYFQVHQETVHDEMFCPYCGLSFPNDDLWTKDQRRFLEDSIEREATEIAEREVDRMLSNIARRSKFLEYKSRPSRAQRRPRPPKETSVDSELECPSCATRFQVLGIFGFCPGCRSENLLLYDANLAIIRQEIATSPNPGRQLRHAYGDLVSTFERFCRKEARQQGIEMGRFQNIEHTRRLFKEKGVGDLFAGISGDEKRLIKRVFERRHIHEHNDGIANERYVKNVPEDAALLGKRVELSEQELTSAAHVLRRMLENIVRSRTS
jgi:uncharacterized Zn-finger protein